ncbi:dipeptidase PepV [Clostridium sp. JN-9]|uniref:dipeptidase PepV n=1 Tax=Clostridium sp. JN-9 TaxID=2507159 RepID=UPI000FFE00E7|nr:dipeptidase PepV [Clostridium sp. JN-9]QAT39258.1 dipeptidase PepV [Clostridium sp. JN-9]
MELNKKVDQLKEDLVKSTQEIVKIKSVEGEPKDGMPFGEDVNNALKCALDISKKLGFKTVNMNGYVGYAEYGEGDDYVAVLGHLDVVPEGNGWKYPAYGAEIHDGKVYGRGTMDDKGPIMTALYGLKAIKDCNLPLSKRVRVIFGTNEETGSKELEYYNAHEKAPISGFTPDAEYPIIYGEKGITIFDVVKDLNNKGCGEVVVKHIKGGERANMVPDYCEAEVEAKNADSVVKAVKEFAEKTGFNLTTKVNNNNITIISKGIGAHGSLPELGKNAVMQLFALLETMPLGKCDLADYVSFFNKHVGFETDGKSFGVALEDKESGKLTFNVGTISMDETKISLSLNLRYPVTYKYDDMMNPFNKTISGTGMRVKNMSAQDPLFFPPDHPTIKTLQKVYKEQTGKEPKLLAIGGGTYAKEMKNIVAFGPIFPGQVDLDHQANEYMEIDDLVANAKIYAHAIYELAK